MHLNAKVLKAPKFCINLVIKSILRKYNINNRIRF